MSDLRSQHGGEYGHRLKETGPKKLMEEHTPIQSRKQQQKKNVLTSLQRMRNQLERSEDKTNQKDLMAKVKFLNGKISKFNAYKESLKQWEYKNQNYLRMIDYYEIDSNSRLRILECMTEEDTSAILRLHMCKDIDEATKFFNLYGGFDTSKGNLHRELEKLHQKGKTLAKFIEEVKWTMLKYDCDNEELLVEYVIEGMENLKAQYEIKRNNVTDLSEIITIEREISKIENCQSKKRKISDIYMIEDSNQKIDSENLKQECMKFDVNQIQAKMIPRRDKVCYQCGKVGLIRRFCPVNRNDETSKQTNNENVQGFGFRV
jgi:hypothetical protein